MTNKHQAQKRMGELPVARGLGEVTRKNGFSMIEMLVAVAIVVVVVMMIPVALDKKRAEMAAQRTAAQKEALVREAASVLIDPNNWKNQAGALTRFTKAAADLTWADRESVTEFKRLALELFEFSASWVGQVDEAQFRRVKDENFKLLGLGDAVSGHHGNAGEANASVGTKASLKVDLNTTTKNQVTENVVKVTSPQLGEEKAKVFSKKFAAALDAFAVICQEAQ